MGQHVKGGGHNATVGPPKRWWHPVDAAKLITFSWVSRIIRSANAKPELHQEDAASICPEDDSAEVLTVAFEKAYTEQRVRPS